MPARTPRSSTATFDLVSCRSMLGKLEREIGRASAAIHREDLADHCTNAAWTAWHLFERVWADMKANPKVKLALAKDAAVTLRDFDRDVLEAFVQSESQCPELTYCKLITNASKHVGADWRSGDPVFVIDASVASSGSVSIGGLDWLPQNNRGDRPLWAFKIVEGESLDSADRTNALHLFQKVRDYWADLIDRHGIGSG